MFLSLSIRRGIGLLASLGSSGCGEDRCKQGIGYLTELWQSAGSF